MTQRTSTILFYIAKISLGFQFLHICVQEGNLLRVDGKPLYLICSCCVLKLLYAAKTGHDSIVIAQQTLIQNMRN